ncbi:hypothetical protein B0H12DRAFT_1246885 [Mycena haematopus]|nr:hypothetical protein B0H12DRAFT_1246885 [Mycena haematopus]
MTSPTPDNSAAADPKYLALWTPDDKRFCAYWRHQLVLPLLYDILGFKTIVENWNEFKNAVVRDINAAFCQVPCQDQPDHGTNLTVNSSDPTCNSVSSYWTLLFQVRSYCSYIFFISG